MSTVRVRGNSRPEILRVSGLTTTGRSRNIKGICHHLEIREVVTNAVRIFFTEEDFDNDANYVEVGTGETWLAPVSAKVVWMKAATATCDVVLVAYV